ncbi:MAG: hypothetical protein H0T89_06170 [Deltaproteobacteria bacterium]|nr:hypothetical protein [Deltaproteobacteria bacterium]
MGSRFLALVPLLGGCPTVDLGDTPTDIGLCNPAGGIEYFEAMIWPEFVRPADTMKGCTRTGGCHDEAGGNALGFRTQPVDFAFNYRQAQVFLNCGTPEASQLLTKPRAGLDAHGGGDLFVAGNAADDAAVASFLAWFD